MRYLPILLVLTGCAGNQIKIPEKVLVPVAVTCIKTEPVKPIFKSHDELKAMPNPDAIKQLAIELYKYESYTGELEAIIRGCK